MTKKFWNFAIRAGEIVGVLYFAFKLCSLLENTLGADVAAIRRGLVVVSILVACWIGIRLWFGFFRKFDFIYDDRYNRW